MTRLAQRQFHKTLEEALAWLEFFHTENKVSDQDLLLFSGGVLGRFAAMLPDFVATLNELSTDPVSDEPPRFTGFAKHPPPPQSEFPDYELISARVRRAPGRELRERQCIGPVVGARGNCVGKGAATAGWQTEAPENFSRKRSHFQARCKACDNLRSGGRQLKLTRRSAAARHWMELSQHAPQKNPTQLLEDIRKLSLSFLEELRADFWTTLQHSAERLLQVSGHSSKGPWFAVDIDRKLIFSGDSPAQARHNAGPEDNRLLVMVKREQ